MKVSKTIENLERVLKQSRFDSLPSQNHWIEIEEK
jgi:hypothetical protein